MPGLLSTMFDPAGDDAGTHSGSNDTAVSADTGTDLAIDQDVGLDLGVTYEDAQGGTHNWQMDNDVGLHADAGASLIAVLGAEQAATDGDVAG